MGRGSDKQRQVLAGSSAPKTQVSVLPQAWIDEVARFSKEPQLARRADQLVRLLAALKAPVSMSGDTAEYVRLLHAVLSGALFGMKDDANTRKSWGNIRAWFENGDDTGPLCTWKARLYPEAVAYRDALVASIDSLLA